MFADNATISPCARRLGAPASLLGAGAGGSTAAGVRLLVNAAKPVVVGFFVNRFAPLTMPTMIEFLRPLGCQTGTL